MTKKKKHPDVPPRRSGRPIKVSVLWRVNEVHERQKQGCSVYEAVTAIATRDDVDERELFRQYDRWKPDLIELDNSQSNGLISDLSTGVNLLHIVQSKYGYAVDLDMDDPRIWCPD